MGRILHDSDSHPGILDRRDRKAFMLAPHGTTPAQTTRDDQDILDAFDEEGAGIAAKE